MKERPILFSSPMVRAILEGRKTQTRRVVKPQPVGLNEPWPNSSSHNCWHDIEAAPEYHGECGNIPFSRGNNLWVKETQEVTNVQTLGVPGNVQWRVTTRFEDGFTRQDVLTLAQRVVFDTRLKPRCRVIRSIFMPRWASRITLEITGVRVERLQEITAEDCIAEGIPSRGMEANGKPNVASTIMYIHDYEQLWDSINGKKHPWKSNPWVWVIEFPPLQPPKQK